MRKRAEKLTANLISYCTVPPTALELAILTDKIELELTAAVKEEREKRDNEIAKLKQAVVAADRALVLCWDTLSRWRVTLSMKRECLLALEEARAKEIFFQVYDNDRARALAALLTEEK